MNVRPKYCSACFFRNAALRNRLQNICIPWILARTSCRIFRSISIAFTKFSIILVVNKTRAERTASTSLFSFDFVDRTKDSVRPETHKVHQSNKHFGTNMRMKIEKKRTFSRTVLRWYFIHTFFFVLGGWRFRVNIAWWFPLNAVKCVTPQTPLCFGRHVVNAGQEHFQVFVQL